LVQGEQRNKWQGPAEGGKDAVYAGCEIEPTEWSATRSEIRFSARLFSDSLPPFSVFACSAVQSFGPLNVCCPYASNVLGLSFYPLEQAPNMVIYAMSKSGTATSGLI